MEKHKVTTGKEKAKVDTQKPVDAVAEKIEYGGVNYIIFNFGDHCHFNQTGKPTTPPPYGP